MGKPGSRREPHSALPDHPKTDTSERLAEVKIRNIKSNKAAKSMK